MKALLIIGGILLFLAFLLLMRIRFCLDFSGKLHIELRVLFLRFRLHPRKITPKRVLRAQKKQRKKVAKQAKKQRTCSKKTPAPKKAHKFGQSKKPSPMAILRLVWHILKSVWRKFPDCFHLYLKRCVIVVGGKDAAETAICYGSARGAIAWFCTLLDTVFTVKTTKKSVLSINADFLSKETKVDLSLQLSTCIGSLLALLFRILIAYLKRPRPEKKKRKTMSTPAEQAS